MHRIAILGLILLTGATSCSRWYAEVAIAKQEAVAGISDVILRYSDELKRELKA